MDNTTTTRHDPSTSLGGYPLDAGTPIPPHQQTGLPLTPQPVKFRILVYSPQFYENYRLQSGEGLSVLFFLAWVIGDLCNLMGATLGGLVPAVILLALYVNFHLSHAN